MAKIYVIDEIVAMPGKGRALLDLYRANYAPAAEARGMVLERVLVSPPVWLDDMSNRLTITWTVEGAGGWWGQATQGRYDPGVGQFWANAAELIESRHRQFGAAEADVAELCHV